MKLPRCKICGEEVKYENINHFRHFEFGVGDIYLCSPECNMCYLERTYGGENVINDSEVCDE